MARKPVDLLEQPLHRPRRVRPHVAPEYLENDQHEIAASLIRPLSRRAREAMGVRVSMEPTPV